MSLYVWFIIILCVALAGMLIFILPRKTREEAIEAQERFVAQWQATVDENPIPMYRERLAEESALLDRMRASHERRYGGAERPASAGLVDVKG